MRPSAIELWLGFFPLSLLHPSAAWARKKNPSNLCPLADIFMLSGLLAAADEGEERRGGPVFGAYFPAVQTFDMEFEGDFRFPFKSDIFNSFFWGYQSVSPRSAWTGSGHRRGGGGGTGSRPLGSGRRSYCW